MEFMVDFIFKNPLIGALISFIMGNIINYFAFYKEYITTPKISIMIAKCELLQSQYDLMDEKLAENQIEIEGLKRLLVKKAIDKGKDKE